MRSDAARAVVFLFVLAALLAAANLFWTAHETNAVAARFAAEQARQRAAGLQAEQKICRTLHALDADKPPAGGADHPSRAYLQHLHDRLAELSPDLGCNRVPGGTSPVPSRSSTAPGTPHAAAPSSRPGPGAITAPGPQPGPPVALPAPPPVPVPPPPVVVTETTTATPVHPSSPGPRPRPSPSCVLAAGVLGLNLCIAGPR